MSGTHVKFGTLEPIDFSVIENLLLRRGVASPICTSENVPGALQDAYTSWSDWAEECIATVRNRLAISADIRFCLIATTKPNAFATRVSDRYIITLQIGIVWERLFRHLLESAEFTAYLGLPPIAGDDQKLREYGSMLASLAFRWVVLHELAHVKNGHLHLSAHCAFGASSSETMRYRPGEIDRNITKQALEMDADSFASTQLLNELRADHDSPLPTTDEARMRTFFAAIYAPIRSFDRSAAPPDQLFHFSHPMGLLRLGQIGAWTHAYSTQFNFLNPELCANLFAQCMALCEPLLRTAGVVPLHSEFETFFPEGFENYGAKILARWSKIRPKLEPHLLGGSLVAAQTDPE